MSGRGHASPEVIRYALADSIVTRDYTHVFIISAARGFEGLPGEPQRPESAV